MYPCPCGYYGDPERECTCSLHTMTRYQKRISGPMLDRIDIQIEVRAWILRNYLIAEGEKVRRPSAPEWKSPAKNNEKGLPVSTTG